MIISLNQLSNAILAQSWFPPSRHICLHLIGLMTEIEDLTWVLMFYWRTSDGGNGNHSVSLPIILLKNKVNQMLPSSYIGSLLVSILWFCIWFPISMTVWLYFGAKMVTFCIIHIGNGKNIFKTSFLPEFQLILLHVSVFSYFTKYMWKASWNFGKNDIPQPKMWRLGEPEH